MSKHENQNEKVESKFDSSPNKAAENAASALSTQAWEMPKLNAKDLSTLGHLGEQGSKPGNKADFNDPGFNVKPEKPEFNDPGFQTKPAKPEFNNPDFPRKPEAPGGKGTFEPKLPGDKLPLDPDSPSWKNPLDPKFPDDKLPLNPVSPSWKNPLEPDFPDYKHPLDPKSPLDKNPTYPKVPDSNELPEKLLDPFKQKQKEPSNLFKLELPALPNTDEQSNRLLTIIEKPSYLPELNQKLLEKRDLDHEVNVHAGIREAARKEQTNINKNQYLPSFNIVDDRR